MDKQIIIASIAETSEDQMLLAKIHDKITAGQRRNIPANTSFLTGREQILAQRRACWQPKAPKYKTGLLKLYAQHAVSPMKGAYME